MIKALRHLYLRRLESRRSRLLRSNLQSRSSVNKTSPISRWDIKIVTSKSNLSLKITILYRSPSLLGQQKLLRRVETRRQFDGRRDLAHLSSSRISTSHTVQSTATKSKPIGDTRQICHDELVNLSIMSQYMKVNNISRVSIL